MEIKYRRNLANIKRTSLQGVHQRDTLKFITYMKSSVLPSQFT